jgi:hypothetical protein
MEQLPTVEGIGRWQLVQFQSDARYVEGLVSDDGSGLPPSSPDSVGDGAEGGGPDAEVVVDAVKHR